MDPMLILLGKQPYQNLGARSRIAELVNTPKAPVVQVRKVITPTQEQLQRQREAQATRKSWWEGG